MKVEKPTIQPYKNHSESPLTLENFKISNPTSQYNIERFWIDHCKIEESKSPFKFLALFVVNLLLISHSNYCIERQFSRVEG